MIVLTFTFLPVLLIILNTVDSYPFPIFPLFRKSKPETMKYDSIADYHYWQWIEKTDL